MKCVVCEKEAEFIQEGTSFCRKHLKQRQKCNVAMANHWEKKLGELESRPWWKFWEA